MVDKEYTFSDGTRIFNEKKNGRFQRFIEYSYTQEQIEMMKKSPNMEKVLSHYIRKYNAGKYYYLNVLWGISASLDQDGKIQLYKKLKDVHDKIGIVNESNILNQVFVSLFGKYYGLTEIHGAAFFATIYLAMLDCEEWKKDHPDSIGKTLVLKSCEAVILNNVDYEVAAQMYRKKTRYASDVYWDDYYFNHESPYGEYNGYNDYDDDTIDIAFDGHPEATWNVD